MVISPYCSFDLSISKGCQFNQATCHQHLQMIGTIISYPVIQCVIISSPMVLSKFPLSVRQCVVFDTQYSLCMRLCQL